MRKGYLLMSEIKKCSGCGAVMQTTDPTHVGYALDVNHTYCQACYQLMHYGVGSTHFHPEDLPKLESDSVIFIVSSVLHLDQLFAYPIHRYQPDATYVYLINQMDLLPDSTNTDDLIERITRRAKKEHIPFQDIILMSAKNQMDLDHLRAYMCSYKEKHMYLVGVQNSGKTTLYKALTNNKEALAFKKAGLTQEALIGHFEDKIIYDMPGLYQQGYLHQMFSYDTYKRLIPDRKIKPVIYQMKPNQTIIIEGLFAITLLGEPTTFVFYMDQKIHYHKTNEQRVRELLDQQTILGIHGENYIDKTFKIPFGKHQITCADMGFLHVEGPNVIKVRSVKGLHLSLSEALFS